MDSQDIPINDNELSSQLTGLNKGENPLFKKKALIGIIAAIIAAIIIVAIIILVISLKSGGNGSNSNKKNIIAEINCIYEVQMTSDNTIK